MRRLLIALLFAATAASAAPRIRAVRTPATPLVALEPAGCAIPPPAADTCDEGSGPFLSLTMGEVDTIARGAAKSISDPVTIAVVDRAGRVLGVLRKAGAGSANDDLAVAVARTAAFFSHNMAPLSSRTVRFISGIHFPPGVTNTASAALYGIENTNRGCDFNVTFNSASQCVPRARRIGGGPCYPGNTAGCGLGIITGKIQPGDIDPSSVNAGGVPLYKLLPSGITRINEGIVTGGQLVGAIGVVGANGDPQIAEFAAATGAFAAGGIVPVPSYPLPQPGNVFVDGIRLPFLGPDLRLELNANGLPVGVKRLEGTGAGTDSGAIYSVAAANGGCAANGYLVGPAAGSNLTFNEVDAIVKRAIATAKKTRALIRLPLNSYARMAIAVADLDGSILALYRMPDATVFSIDVAVAKARNVIWFSGGHDLPVPSGTAITNRTLNFGAQPFYPPGIDSSVFNPTPGPWYQSLFVTDLLNPCSQGSQPLDPPRPNQNGIVFFAGSSPLYRGSVLAGGLGVSGDGIEQDDYVTYYGAGEFLPAQAIWADRLKVGGARLPMFKFPRQPEGVTECGGHPCS
jgi:uncharacterized protein GlcG (DUF336 family)